MGKCSCNMSHKMPKCDGTCKKLKKEKKKTKPDKDKKDKEKGKKKLKELKNLCSSLMLYIFMREKNPKNK